MKAKVITCLALLGMGGAAALPAYATIYDDFEDGIVNPALWVTNGYNGGVGGVGSGSWQNSIDEHTGSDGYLQARVWGPTSGNTYGAEARVRTAYDFNDGGSWLINFTWETAVSFNPHVDGFAVSITDGSDPNDNDWAWIAKDTHPGSELLWRYQLHTGDANWQGDTPNPSFSKQTWSVVVDPAGYASIYQSGDAQGAPYGQVTLDPSREWYLGFVLNDATSAGFDGGDNAFRLYEFSAVPEPATLSVLGIGGLALLRRRRK